jgi:hypothetical protein
MNFRYTLMLMIADLSPFPPLSMSAIIVTACDHDPVICVRSSTFKVIKGAAGVSFNLVHPFFDQRRPKLTSPKSLQVNPDNRKSNHTISRSIGDGGNTYWNKSVR